MSAAQEINQNIEENGPDDLVNISLNNLIIGRSLNSPLYDNHGVLLLAAGSTISQEVKEALRNRGDNSVMVSRQDLSRVTINQIDPGKVESIVKFDS